MWVHCVGRREENHHLYLINVETGSWRVVNIYIVMQRVKERSRSINPGLCLLQASCFPPHFLSPSKSLHSSSFLCQECPPFTPSTFTHPWAPATDSSYLTLRVCWTENGFMAPDKACLPFQQSSKPIQLVSSCDG